MEALGSDHTLLAQSGPPAHTRQPPLAKNSHFAGLPEWELKIYAKPSPRHLPGG